MILFITADRVGSPSGGGLVCTHELRALIRLGNEPYRIYDRDAFPVNTQEPWGWDDWLVERVGAVNPLGPNLAHFYSGSFPRSAQLLKDLGWKITWTVAAHDKEVSRREHEKLGWGFPYPHLTDPYYWSRYIEGYRLADVIICPSTVAAQTVWDYGSDFANKRIEVIPHGCEIPSQVRPLPPVFTAGYLGSLGADKGVRYLLEAWKSLNYKDARLLLAGRDSAGPLARHLLERFGGGNVSLLGWQDNVSDFYNQISLLVQPSATEGFGIEVIEAMAHGRSAVCSEGAGAQDLLPDNWKVPACDARSLAAKIDSARNDLARGFQEDKGCRLQQSWQEQAEKYTWGKVRQRYLETWRSIL